MPGRNARIAMPGPAIAGAAIAITLAALALAGWWSGSPLLKGLVPGGVAMNPVTALCFMAAAAALLGTALEAPPPGIRAVSRWVGVAVAAVGGLKLLAIAGAPVPPFDRLLFEARLAAEAIPNQMAPNTAAAFVVLGLALGGFEIRTRQGGARPAHVLFALVAGMSLLTLIGYGYGARAMYEMVGYIAMAANTALCFLSLSLGGLAARRGEALERMLAGTSPAAHVGRCLLPASLLVPVALGWTAQGGASMGEGLALTAVAIAAVMAGIVWLTTRRLERSDRERRRIEDELRRTLARQNRLLESNLIGIVTLDETGTITQANRGFLDLLGFRESDLPLAAERHTCRESLALDRRAMRALHEHGAVQPYEKECLRRDGTRVPLITGAVHVPETGEYLAFGFDLTERKRIEAELESFSYSVSHDLRAPLRHIAGFADLVAAGAADRLDETERRRLQVIVDSAQRMGQMIDDLLAFSRVGRSEMRRDRVSLDQLIAEIRREPMAEQSPPRVEWRVGPLPDVVGDRALLRLAFANLVSNALKYSSRRENAVIEIGARTEPSGRFAIWVRDNGAGFDPRHAGKLFGVFQRLHRADEFPGTGIGLANVRRIVERHEGRVVAEGAVDQGATFTVILPGPPPEETAWAA